VRHKWLIQEFHKGGEIGARRGGEEKGDGGISCSTPPYRERQTRGCKGRRDKGKIGIPPAKLRGRTLK